MDNQQLFWFYKYQNSSTTIPSGSTSKASVDGNEKNPNKDCDIV